ncbi:KR domain [Rhizoctonia solani]|uniref:KR domain n=1 Tax=Rhizoctonia solani TaxID=456999 RepID=A0A8H7M3T7_9AGAM|nr:KR domain [Rhizoctonia solani]
MIIPDSEKSDSSPHSTTARSQTSFGPVDAPPSPPSYSETIASDEDRYRDRSHSPQSGGFRTTSFTRSGLPPRCNHAIDRKMLSSVTGNWHVDTALEIPERLLPPITDFDGRWNREAQQTRKARAEASGRPQVWSSNSNRNPIPPLVETRPNLMLAATNGAISGDIHVVSSDGLIRQSTIVAEGCNGSINLRIHAPPDQLLRVFASSTNGSINVKVPSSFEGAITMSTSWGNVNVSQSIRAKLTTFSSTSNASRGFIGDWQAQGFGDTESHIDDPPRPGPRDPFATWTGPLVDLSSTNGSVNLSYIEEDTPSASAGQFTRAIQGFMNSWFGGTGQNDSTGNSGSPRPHPPPNPTHVSSVALACAQSTSIWCLVDALQGSTPVRTFLKTTFIQMRVAIVTGAAQGIGRAIALRLAADGLAVGVNDLSSGLEGLNGLVDEITSHGGKALAVPADISKEPEVIGMVKTVCDAFGGLDVMVANAGISGPQTTLVEMSEDDFDRVMSVNCKGTLYSYRAAARQMLKQGPERGGRIIGASSICGLKSRCPSSFAPS